jgi:hypothetical protein
LNTVVVDESAAEGGRVVGEPNAVVTVDDDTVLDGDVFSALEQAVRVISARPISMRRAGALMLESAFRLVLSRRGCVTRGRVSQTMAAC